MDYDLNKKIKFVSEVFYDPGNHYEDFGESIENYFKNSFITDSARGKRKEIDFDFGIIVAANKHLRIGFHFQSPFFTIYWKFAG